MQLKDPAHLRDLMRDQNVSWRELSHAAGWRSPGSLARLIRSTNPHKSIQSDRALRIAAYLGKPVEDLFSSASSFRVELRQGARRNGTPK